MICTWLCLGNLSVRVGDSSLHSEETVKILNCAFQCDHYSKFFERKVKDRYKHSGEQRGCPRTRLYTTLSAITRYWMIQDLSLHCTMSPITRYWMIQDLSLHCTMSPTTRYWMIQDPSLHCTMSPITRYWMIQDSSLHCTMSAITRYWMIQDLPPNITMEARIDYSEVCWAWYALYSITGSTSTEPPVKSIFPLELTWVLIPFPKTFGWEYKLRSRLCTYAFHHMVSKDPDIHVPDGWIPATKTPCRHHPRRRKWLPLWLDTKNKHGHIRKNLTQNGEAQRYSWECRKKKKNHHCVCHNDEAWRRLPEAKTDLSQPRISNQQPCLWTDRWSFQCPSLHSWMAMVYHL